MPLPEGTRQPEGASLAEASGPASDKPRLRLPLDAMKRVRQAVAASWATETGGIDAKNSLWESQLHQPERGCDL